MFRQKGFFSILLVLGLSTPILSALAASHESPFEQRKKEERRRREQQRAQEIREREQQRLTEEFVSYRPATYIPVSNRPQTSKPANLTSRVTRRSSLGSDRKVRDYLIDLEVPELDRYYLEDKIRNLVGAADSGDLTEDQKAKVLGLFSEQSVETLAKVFRSFGRTSYANGAVLGLPGVGKTHLLNQVAAMFTMGIMPDYVAKALEGPGGAFSVLKEAFIGKTDIIVIDSQLLAEGGYEKGEAIPSQEMRMRKTLRTLFSTAREQYLASGRRTVFVMEEMATFPDWVKVALKTIQDVTGFHDPKDPFLGAMDPGYFVLGMTTPEEFQKMMAGDGAAERRYRIIDHKEATVEQSFNILKARTAGEWKVLYGLEIEDEALRLIIEMRDLLHSPPQALPGSVLTSTNDLFLWEGLTFDPEKKPVITLKDAERFIMAKVGLTEKWFEGPNGEPPFHDIIDYLKKKVKGQDEVVEKVAEIMKSWARLSFGGVPPFIILGGPHGSGKDTLINALNEYMFGKEGSHLNISIAGASGNDFKVESILEGPPLGNHSDGKLPLLIQRLMQGGLSILALNEARDATTGDFEKLKAFTGTGLIHPMGQDSRIRKWLMPIFIVGQWGEELFEGKSQTEINEIYSKLTQEDIIKILRKGKGDGKTGVVSEALIDRAAGLFILRPPAQENFGKIVDAKVSKITIPLNRKRIKTTATPAWTEYVSNLAIQENGSPRPLERMVEDFSMKAISKAQDQGLALRDMSVELDYQNGKIIVKQLQPSAREWSFTPEELRSTKQGCSVHLLPKK